MSADLSLSDSLGPLRIANISDDEAMASPTSPTPRPPPPTSHSSDSTSTITNANQPNRLGQLALESPDHDSGLGFNPDSYNWQPAQPAATSHHSRSPSSIQTDLPRAQLTHRASMPLSVSAAEHAMASPSNYPNSPQMRVPNSHSTSAVRPTSDLYSQHNTSSSSNMSSQGSYRYKDELGLSDSSGGPMGRSGSRVARHVSGSGSVPARESSRTHRQPSIQRGAGNGPLPPRRNSQRARAPTASSASAAVSPRDGPDVPFAGPASVPRTTEEWRQRGAAVVMQKETDASGQTHSRVIKKGVKDFNFGRTLGEGSYSTVLAATDRQNLKEYAIKVLDKRHIIKEKKVKYVNIERDTLNRLTEHPGIVRLYYTFQDERSLYFVLDLASGGELLGVLKKLGSFDVECTRFYGAEILDSIAYMHSRGVIHRDLKPENVLLDRDMHVKITDFGTAKILPDPKPSGSNGTSAAIGDPTDSATSDRAVSFVGTAEYVSPELLRDKNACKASDLWAFGCILFQLLAGRPPFKAANEYLTFQKILALDYTFPEGFPELARDLVERLLVLEPTRRLPIEHIKNHRFFEGISWGKGLWRLKSPRLKAYVPPAAEPIRLNGAGTSTPANLPVAVAPAPSSQSQSSRRPQLSNVTELAPPSQLDIDWSPVLTHPNERILKLGNLIVFSGPPPSSPTGKSGDPQTPSEKPKFSRFFSSNVSKRRERLVLITSAARLVVAAAGGNEKKAKLEVDLSAKVSNCKICTDLKGLTYWSIDTRDKYFSFEDPRATTSDPAGSKWSTQEWIDAVEQAREVALATSVANSYSGESMFTDALSSPAESLGGGGGGGDAAMPMSGPSATERHTLRHTLRRHTDDESLKGRKRFSKRHSKSGLAAVF